MRIAIFRAGPAFFLERPATLTVSSCERVLHVECSLKLILNFLLASNSKVAMHASVRMQSTGVD